MSLNKTPLFYYPFPYPYPYSCRQGGLDPPTAPPTYGVKQIIKIIRLVYVIYTIFAAYKNKMDNVEKLQKEINEKVSYIIERSKKSQLTYQDAFNAVVIEKLSELLERKNYKDLDTYISDLDLSCRTYNCLKSAEIRTIRDLIKYSEVDLIRFRNFGKRSLTELKEFLLDNNLTLKNNVEPFNESPYAGRNRILFEDYTNGIKRKDLSIKYGLSYVRVGQIINRIKRKAQQYER